MQTAAGMTAAVGEEAVQVRLFGGNAVGGLVIVERAGQRIAEVDRILVAGRTIDINRAITCTGESLVITVLSLVAMTEEYGDVVAVRGEQGGRMNQRCITFEVRDKRRSRLSHTGTRLNAHVLRDGFKRLSG